LPDELQACVEMAAKLHGLEPATFVQLMIAENIAAYIQKGHEKQDGFRRLLEEGQQGT
jgi:hypothetical protein